MLSKRMTPLWLLAVLPVVIFVAYWGINLSTDGSTWKKFWWVVIVIAIVWVLIVVQTNLGPGYDDPTAPDCTPTKFVDC